VKVNSHSLSICNSSTDYYGLMPHQWKKSIIQPIYKDDKNVYSSYGAISLLSTSCNNLSNILLSSLTSYIDEIIGDWQHWFWLNRSTTDQRINGTVHQLFIDFKKACDSVRMEVLYNILIGFGVPMKKARLLKMCLNETYNKVHTCKNVSNTFPTQNYLKQGDVLWPLFFQLCSRICH
jgi:hypothetical protein